LKKEERLSNQVFLEGRITIDNAEQVRSRLEEAIRSGSAEIAVNLAGVNFMDTSGLATLLEAMRVAQGLRKRLTLECFQDQPRYLFRVTDLDHLFEIQGDCGG
jgi:anti-sigma B factor antagonist